MKIKFPLPLVVANFVALVSCSAPADSQRAAATTTPTDGRALITIETAGQGKPLDPRLFGTNVPAWNNPTILADEKFRALAKASGTTVLRLPGGSWSDAYSWYDCETGNSQGCHWTWAAKPSDFLKFVKATGAQAMWTVSLNGTSKEAAALVAFFNGSESDTTLIGLDIRGRDWKRVGDWARLRASTGSPEPLPIKLWEVGNEVYGAKPSMGGSNCAAWGWSDIWTCDANEYMLGKGSGTTRHEGYLEFRTAMRRVDPSIQVGAVGVPQPGEWWEWGNKVLEKGGTNVDFYIIHSYGYDKQPASAATILPRPFELWKGIIPPTIAAFDKLGAKRRIPIAVTEYNMAAFQDLDNAQLMTRAVNALFMADMVGQMAFHGAAMANQWNLANGKAGNGTDYGLIDSQTGNRAPQYYALKLWTTMGRRCSRRNRH
jgi:hypothetical protein